MPLLQRVTTLIRANLNDLMDKAEDPAKILKQLLLDLQNQYLQVKTQVAMAIADQHLLEKKRAENVASQAEFVRKAQVAVRKNDENLARAALARSVACEAAAAGFAQQLEDQAEEVRLLREALQQLEMKIAETRAKAEMVSTRRPKNGSRAAAVSFGHLMLAAPETNARLEAMDREEQVDRLLADLRTKAGQ